MPRLVLLPSQLLLLVSSSSEKTSTSAYHGRRRPIRLGPPDHRFLPASRYVELQACTAAWISIYLHAEHTCCALLPQSLLCLRMAVGPRKSTSTCAVWRKLTGPHLFPTFLPSLCTFRFCINIFLTILGYFPGLIHAVSCTESHVIDRG